MTMRTALFLLALFAISLHAGEVRLGPELPLSPDRPMQAAFGKQISPDVATDGNGFLAVWTDSRSLSAAARPDIVFRGETWVSRLRADGTSVEPFGRRLASFVNAIVGSNGDGYLVAGNDSTLQVIRVDTEGSPQDTQFSVPDRRPVELVSNGSTYLLFSADRSPTFPQQVRATLLDGSGRRLFESPEVFQDVIAAGARDGNYYFIEISSGLVPVLRTINAAGDVAVGGPLPIPLTQYPKFVAAFARDTILIGWAATNRIEYAVVTYDGTLVKTQTLPFGTAVPWTAAWDGRQFLLTFDDFAVRIGVDGTLIDSAALPLRIPRTAAVVSNGNRGLFVWADDRFTAQGDIVARPFGSFDDLAIQDDSATLVSWSGPPALQPQIVRSGGHELAAWVDPEASLLRGSLDGRPLTMASIGFPAGYTVAAGKNTFLVAWHDYLPHEMLAKRLGMDGSVIDTQPLILASDIVPLTVVASDVLAATFDGVAYQVVWNSAEIRTRYIFEDGRMSEQIAAWGDPERRAAYSPRLLPTGNGNFLVYAIYNPGGPLAGDWMSPPWSLITGVPVSALSDAAFTPALFQSERVAELDATISEDRVTYVWSSDGDIFVAQSTLDAHWLVRPIRVVDNSSLSCTVRMISRPAAMWNGQEIVIAWTEGNGCDELTSTEYTVRAFRLNANLSPLDREPIELARGATPDGPCIIPTPEGVAIAYSRFDDSNGGAPRAFMRALARSDAPPPSRRRGVRP